MSDATPTDAVNAPRRKRLWGRPAAIVAGAGALALVIFAALHSPPARRWVAGLITERLAAAGVEARIGALRYSLLDLDVQVEDLQLRAPTADDPFLVADTLRVDLPWSIVFGDLFVETVEVGNARVRLGRDAGGSWNLPTGSSGSEANSAGASRSGAAPGTLPRIGRLQVEVARLEIVDAVSAVGLELPGLTLTADDLVTNGRLALASPGTLRFEDRTLPVRNLGGNFAWDGSSLALRGLAVDLAVAMLTVDGALVDLAAEPDVDLEVGVAAALGEVGAFLDLDDFPAGEVALSGRVNGALTSPSASIDVDSNSLVWRQLEASGLSARLTVSPEAVAIDALRATVAGGAFTGRAELGYGNEDLPGSVHAEIDSMAAWPLSGLAGEDAPRLASVLDATADASWSRWPAGGAGALAAEVRVTARRAAPDAAPPGLPLEGGLELSVDGGGWQLTGDPHLGGALAVGADLQGRLGEPLAETSLGGTLQVTSADLSRLPAALGNLAPTMPEPTGSGGAVLRLDGTVSRPVFEGPLELERPGVAGIAADRLTGRLMGSGGKVAIEDLVIERNDDRVAGNAGVDFDTGALNGRLTATIADLSGALPDAAAEIISAGSLRVEGTLGGSLEAPRFEVMARAAGVDAAGQPRLDVEARAVLDNGTVRLDELVARQSTAGEQRGGAPPMARRQAAGQAGVSEWGPSACRAAELATGCLRLTGDWQLASGDLSLRAQAHGARVEPIVVDGSEIPVSGTFDLDVDGRHDAAGLVGEATLDADDLALYGLQPGPVRVVATGDGDAVELHATASELATRLEGRVARGGDFELRGELDRLPLQRLLQLSGRELQANLTAGFAVAGNLGGGGVAAAQPGSVDTGVSITHAALELRALDGTLDGVRLRLLEAGTVELAGDTLRTDGLGLGLGNASLRIDGSYPTEESPLLATLTGDLADLESLVVLATGTAGGAAPLAMNGALDARLELAGTAGRPRVTARVVVRDGDIGTGEVPPLRNLDLEITLDEGVVGLDNLSASWQGAEITASGRLPLGLVGEASALPQALDRLPLAEGPASFEARIGPLGPEALRPFLPAETVDQIAGQIAGRLTLGFAEARLAAIEGSLVLEQADVSISNARLTQRAPTRLELANGRVEVRELRWGGLGTELRVTGSAPLDAAGDVSLQARGPVDLRILQLLLPGAVAGGTGELGVDLTGTPAEPNLAGGIDIRNAELRVPAARLAFLDVTGRIATDGATLIIEPVAGELNGGAFVLTGEIPLDASTGGHLDLTAVDVAVQPVDGLRSLLDLGLGLDLSEGLPGRLHGTVTITRGSYRERMSVVGGLLEQMRGVAAAAPGASASMLDDLRLDLRIVSENDLMVDNNLAELFLAADLQLTGTVGSPGVTGRAEILPGGTVYLARNRFRIESGAIDFVSARAIEPEFAINARTRVNDYDVTLSITGTPAEPDIDLTSDPPLPEADIASLLVTGRTLESAESAQTAVAQEQLMGLLAAEFTGQLGEALGLDSVRLERGPVQESFRTYPSIIATETDPTQRLTMSKRLRPDLELVFSQALGSSGGFTWLVKYALLRALEVEALFDDDDNRALRFGQQLNFGGGEAAERRAAATEEAVVVTMVDIEGDSALPVSELRDALSVRPGDRFDFFRWQEDRERLADLHRRRGWLEVRVDAARGEAEGGAASGRLVYTIATGPRTSIVVSGADLPDDVRERVETAWERSVLDDFLLEEARAIVRMHLARLGFVAPQVDPSIDDTTPGEKRLVLNVDPGPRADRLEVAVTGNRRINADVIRAVVQQLDPPETAWVDAGAAGDALRVAYAAEGMPAAEVAVGEPRHEGGIAVLPVEVVEGPRYRVGDVQLVGVETMPAAEVQASLTVVSGEPYVPARLAASRRTLESLYRNRGYTAAEVDIDVPTPDADAQPGADDEIDVPVTFRVREGPVQRVADIEVQGATITRASVIDRALEFEVGDRADRSVMAQARKRLYDTGAFRRVGIEVEPIAPVEGGEVPVRVIVSVGERPPFGFRYGLRLNSRAPLEEAASRQYEPGVATELTSRNLLGRTLSAGVAGRYQPDFRIGRVFVTSPRFFGLPLISSAFVSRSREEVTVEFFGLERSDIVDFTDLTLEQRFAPFDGAQLAYSYSFQRVHTAEKDADPDDPFSFPIIIDVSRLALSGLLDYRDDPFDATRGWFHSSLLEYSATALGSDIPFAKYLLQQYYYQPVGRVTLASAVRLGVAAAFEGQELIRSERFLAGGGNSVRGYEENSLGPTDFFGPTGGNSLLELKQEVRFPIAWWFRGVGFVDAGNVFATLDDVSLRGLKVGTGFGLRVDTPFALLRLDYGFALNRDPGAPRGRFFLSLGQAF